MLLNKIILPYTATPTNSIRTGILNSLAFADDVETSLQVGDPFIDTVVTVCTRYLPENVDFSNTLSDSSFYISVNRQDKKTIPLVPLSTAVFGQGMIINETQFGSSAETYFLNSYKLTVGREVYRVGVSNFTQTQDNNPFSTLTAETILYFEA